MKQVGRRRAPQIVREAKGVLLPEVARFSEAMSALAPSTFVPKGVYRFKTHGDANRHRQDCLARGIGLLAAHGYQRATTVIDVVFPATAVASQRAKDALMALPDQAAKEIEASWFEEGENIRVADAFVVDIMLNANDQTYETRRPYAQTVDLDGIPVRTISLRVCCSQSRPRVFDSFGILTIAGFKGVRLCRHSINPRSASRQALRAACLTASEGAWVAASPAACL